MPESVEKWALAAMLLAVCVLLVGAVLEQEWLWAAVWTAAIVLVCFALRRRSQHAV